MDTLDVDVEGSYLVGRTAAFCNIDGAVAEADGGVIAEVGNGVVFEAGCGAVVLVGNGAVPVVGNGAVAAADGGVAGDSAGEQHTPVLKVVGLHPVFALKYILSR